MYSPSTWVKTDIRIEDEAGNELSPIRGVTGITGEWLLVSMDGDIYLAIHDTGNTYVIDESMDMSALNIDVVNASPHTDPVRGVTCYTSGTSWTTLDAPYCVDPNPLDCYCMGTADSEEDCCRADCTERGCAVYQELVGCGG